MTPLRPVAAALAACLLVAGVAACLAAPGPPPLAEEGDTAAKTETETGTPTDTPTLRTRTQVQVGVDRLRNGLNPHLVDDESEVVRDVAKLVLPSAFVDGVRDPDVLEAATVLPTTPAPGIAMTVRYVIADEAQWSDGTPITGADFVYLWRGMSSTPGVVDPAGYRAIAQVRVLGERGKTVDVDFRAPVREWTALFDFLLPSHVLAVDASDFATALSETIPASAGRYMVANVDRGRGTLTLNRNDRYWGPDPAHIDILTLASVRETTQLADQLRVGQLAFVDKAPKETTGTVLSLVPGVQTRFVDGPRTLGVTLSVSSQLLGTLEAREELRSLIDVPLLARVAAGRTSDLPVAEHRPVSQEEPAILPGLVRSHHPVRVGADPSDAEAAAAARSLVDILASRGVDAQVVSTDTRSLTAESLPSGVVDVVVGWATNTGTAPALAGRLYCQPETHRAGNLSGLCTSETEAVADDILAGRLRGAPARAAVAEALDAAAVWVPVLHERRIHGLTGGIVGPSPDLEQWPGGLATAAQWRMGAPDPEQAPN
ncbi:ABC transporter family substrate-binding protein [Corynebacterium timonense]|uniref:ABC-type transport system, substrate-binding protein n=1 Tax=Corynebacterium timonense TaxID=441500 RepID=A0A1H1QGW2_9CORY|nr:ABC transporter family substrate-binding protein [Corynebacterium timonense]SDS22634.1 ABC-type transport system, substrate-binding protein [Corynebacterium timonense]